MSATAPLRRPASLRLSATAPARGREATKATARPRLVLITQRRSTAGRLPFMILIGAVLSLGLVGVLLLHMVAAQDAYRANQMQAHLATLTDQEQQLATAVEADSSPDALRASAIALGMRPATVSSFRQLKDGRAIGLQTPVYLPPAVTHSATPKAGKAGAVTGKTADTTTTGTSPTGKTGTTGATATGTTTGATGATGATGTTTGTATGTTPSGTTAGTKHHRATTNR